MPIIVGISGFLLLFLADVLDVLTLDRGGDKRMRKITAGLRIVGYSAVSIPLLWVALNLDTQTLWFFWPGLPRVTLWVLAAFSLGMLLWTVFFEIKTIRKKKGVAEDALVSEGSYSRCRHPGFWWFVALALCLGALEPSDDNVLMLLVMILLDLILVWVQDSILFPKLFVGYDGYRKTVPFLIPRRLRHKST